METIQLSENFIKASQRDLKFYSYNLGTRNSGQYKRRLKAMGVEKLNALIPFLSEHQKTIVSVFINELTQKDMVNNVGTSDQFHGILSEIEGTFVEYEEEIRQSVVNQLVTLRQDFLLSELSIEDYREKYWPKVEVKKSRYYKGPIETFMETNPKWFKSDFYSLIYQKGFAQSSEVIDKKFDDYVVQESIDYVEHEKNKLRKSVVKYLAPLEIKTVKKDFIRSSSKGFAGTWSLILTDGTTRLYETRSIIASGPIQRIHMRYISHVK